MHPLSPDLTQLTEEELHTKRSELMNRLNMAHKMGHPDMVNQLTLLLQDYALEIEQRNKKLLDEAEKSGRFGNKDSKDITDET
jgi:hypothetical protein